MRIPKSLNRFFLVFSLRVGCDQDVVITEEELAFYDLFHLVFRDFTVEGGLSVGVDEKLV